LALARPRRLCVPRVPTLTILIGIAGKSIGEAGDAR